MSNILRVLGCMLFQGNLRAPVVDLSGKTVALTGPSPGGIGAKTAAALGKFGARMILGARDPAKASALADSLPGAEVKELDLADQGSVDAFTDAVADVLDGARLDVLVCNAGVHFNDDRHDASGVETTFRVCALSHLSLIRRLRPRRVVWLTGDIYVLSRGAPDPFLAHSGQDAYNRACLARLLLLRELKSRAKSEGEEETAFVAVHPGVIGTNLMRDAPAPVRAVMERVLLSPEQGAQASILAASCPEGELRQEWDVPYFHNKRGWVRLPEGDAAMDAEGAKKLYEQCEELLKSDRG